MSYTVSHIISNKKTFLRSLITTEPKQSVDVFWGATSFKLEGRLLELYLS